VEFGLFATHKFCEFSGRTKTKARFSQNQISLHYYPVEVEQNHTIQNKTKKQNKQTHKVSQVQMQYSFSKFLSRQV
jgi:hypothetical protein